MPQIIGVSNMSDTLTIQDEIEVAQEESNDIQMTVSTKRNLMWKISNAIKYVLPYPRKIYNYIGINRSIISHKVNHRYFPFKMGVEASSRCNLKCPLCPRTTLDREVGNMEYTDFTKLLDKMSPFLFQVRFHVLGEPTLNPQLPKMIKYTHKKGIYTNFHTNGHYLNDHLIKALIDAGLDEINVAIDGMSEEVYKQYRVGGSVERVKKGIVRSCQLKNEFRSKTPRINLQYLVMSHNEHEIKDLHKFASIAGVDWVFLKTVNIMNGMHSGDRSYLPNDRRYSRYLIENGKIELVRPHKCSRVFSELIVNWDGSISICLNDDLQARRIKGNVFKDDLKEILFGNEFIEARRKSLNMEYDICRYCVEC